MTKNTSVEPVQLVLTKGCHMHWSVSTPATLEAVRRHAPLVSCITNTVVTDITTSVPLALGAAPVMMDITGETDPFARVASMLLINLDTSQPEQWDVAREVVAAATDAGTPWVLDPVAIGALTHRTALTRELLGRGPSVIRGNASEILALVGDGSGGRGVEAVDDVAVALGPACDLARSHGCVVVISGPIDLVTDGGSVIHVQGGSALPTRMTGGGCALGVVVAAFLGAGRKEGLDDVSAVAATHAIYSAATERAEVRLTGPGSFPSASLDVPYILKIQDLQNVSASATSATTATGGGPA